MVADNESGKSIESEVRTSSGMFIGKSQVFLEFLNHRLFDILFADLIWPWIYIVSCLSNLAYVM